LDLLDFTGAGIFARGDGVNKHAIRILVYWRR